MIFFGKRQNKILRFFQSLFFPTFFSKHLFSFKIKSTLFGVKHIRSRTSNSSWSRDILILPKKSFCSKCTFWQYFSASGSSVEVLDRGSSWIINCLVLRAQKELWDHLLHPECSKQVYYQIESNPGASEATGMRSTKTGSFFVLITTRRLRVSKTFCVVFS